MGLFGRRSSGQSFGTAESITSSANALGSARTRRGKETDESSLTAAGFRVNRPDMDTLRRLIMPWQARSYAYYDLLGEIKYAAQFYSRALSQLTLFPAERDEDGDIVETSNEAAVAALERIQDPGGGRSALLAAYGRLMFLAGEAYLFVSEDPDTGIEQWEMLSTDELRIQSGMIMRYKAPSLYAENYHLPDDDDWEEVQGNNAVPYRLWQRHPRYSMLADSTMQGVLDLCEELVILTRAVRSRARSRMAGSGLLLIDDRITATPPKPGADEDPKEDPFIAALTEAMTTPIADEGSASAVVPLVARVHAPEGMRVVDMVSHIQIIDPTQFYPETGLRYECIKRIAIGLDMPPEILLGIMDANHWTGWMIDEQSWKAHLQPKAQQLVDDLTASYFQPALRDQGIADWQKYSIAYDASAIINHPDRFKDAKDAYAMRAIGKKAVRDAGGFDEEDAPTQDELAEMVGVATHDPSLAWYGVPSVKGGTVETAPGELEKAGEGTAGTNPAATGAEVEPGPPPGESTDTTITGATNGHPVDSWRVLAAADLALYRAREIAGNRVRALAKKDKEAQELINGVRPGVVAATLGRERVRALKAPPDRELVSGCGEMIVDALRLWGITDEALVELVVDNVEQHAARTLYDLRPAGLPTTFTNYVHGLTTAKA